MYSNLRCPWNICFDLVVQWLISGDWKQNLLNHNCSNKHNLIRHSFLRYPGNICLDLVVQRLISGDWTYPFPAWQPGLSGGLSYQRRSKPSRIGGDSKPIPRCHWTITVLCNCALHSCKYYIIQSNLVIRNVLIRNKLVLRNFLRITNIFIP